MHQVPQQLKRSISQLEEMNNRLDSAARDIHRASDFLRGLANELYGLPDTPVPTVGTNESPNTTVARVMVLERALGSLGVELMRLGMSE